MADALLTRMFLISCCWRGKKKNLKLKTYYKLQSCLFVVWSFAVFCWPRTLRLREPLYIQKQTRLINYLHASESGVTREIKSNVFVSICCFNSSHCHGGIQGHMTGGMNAAAKVEWGGSCLELMPWLQHNYRFQISFQNSSFGKMTPERAPCARSSWVTFPKKYETCRQRERQDCSALWV